MTIMARSTKLALLGMAALILAACAAPQETVTKAPEPLGDFKLGIVTVFADNVEKGPFSREATPQELASSLKAEVESVFRPFPGTKFYNLALSIDAYALALPGIPLLAQPKSALVVTLNVWDDAKGERIYEERKQFTILERITGGSLLLGSGLTLTREEQLAELNKLAVIRIERWLRENEALFAPVTDG
jgi:hypothetical protein